MQKRETVHVKSESRRDSCDNKPRYSYSAPTLERLGSLREVVRGGTGANPDGGSLGLGV